MIHAKMTKPRIFPWNSARQPEQIDRLQEISGDLTLNRDKVYELGRIGNLDYRKRSPSFTGRLRQYENGSMKLWYALANKKDPSVGDSHYVTLDDFANAITDISAYLTDDNGVFTGSAWFTKLRVNGFTINIGDPDAILERTINVVSEGAYELPNVHFCYASAEVESGDPEEKEIELSPEPLPYASNKYIFRVLRIRNGAFYELVEDTSGTEDDTWTYSSTTKKISVRGCELGDLIKVYYMSNSAYATEWENVDTTPQILLAEYCEIYAKLSTSSRIHKLQSLGVDVSFTRTDYKEIGSSEVTQTGIKDKLVRISLNRYLEGFTLEKLLAGETGYSFIDPSEFTTNLQVLIKVFNDKAHSSFKIGYLMTNITPATLGLSVAVEDYLKSTTTLECDNLKISDVESELAFV